MAVEDLEEALAYYQSLGFRVSGKSDYTAIGAVRAMVHIGESGLELFQFTDLTTPAALKIKKHTALTTDDLEADLQKFLDAGYELALPIDKGNVVKRYVYVKDKLDNYIELCEPLEKED